MTPVSEIKLIRTDTTLDLSQKAEKVCSTVGVREVYIGVKATRDLMGSSLKKKKA